jgi:hypothetical protein
VEFLFHFIFTLIKIALQASVYATILLFLVAAYAGFYPHSALARASTRPKRFWWLGGFCISAALLLFSFTYWGNHGLGDYARIPLGHGEAMEEINGMEAYFEAEVPLKLSADRPFIESFQVADDVLCGQANDKSFFTYDLVTKQQRSFSDASEYATYAAQHSLPAVSELKPFGKQYSDYWGGWRFWLLA